MSTLVHDPPFPRNYARELLELSRGRGVYLEDAGGTRYLDLGAGIAVNALGYGRRDLARIAARQMRKLIHVSNLYTTRPSLELASLLLSLTGSLGEYAAVQFGNSGAEANEAAIKYARLYAHRTRGPGHHKILSFSNGFHGRTMGALSTTPNPKYTEPFQPLVPGMVTCKFNDVDQMTALLNEQFAAVIVEVVQGEGGLHTMTPEFAAALNDRCRELDVMLIADEVQTGLGRTGALFGSERVGLRPDILTLSKPLAGGLPLSATLITSRINELLSPGDHGTTFGGGPVTCAVALMVVKTISDPAFLAHVNARAELLGELLDQIAARSEEVFERRGVGLLQGVVISAVDQAARIAEIMASCRDKGVLLLRSSSNVVRIAPPLVISETELRRGVDVLRSCLK
jgi:acetylornithine/N-succinyldiaminopimelate aminotransferase